jgi:4-hydroxy-3-methylbut-2-enyl diphosphate reductase
MSQAPERQLLIASPRGFCAGVDRAIEVVEQLLAADVAPLYVRKEIVHNQAVVADFKGRGVIFVEDLDEVPDGATVVFSAHGVSPEVRADAERRKQRTIDATCPLVTKVHREVVQQAAAGRHIILIGHAGHDEVLGTMGEAPASISLVSNTADIDALEIPAGAEVAYVAQTTLSVDETRSIVAALKERFSDLIEPARSDICYATQNRQDAVKDLVAQGISHLVVVGSPNSSNSQRLCEVARRAGVSARLVDGPQDLQVDALKDHLRIGLTAGASAPEYLVQEVVAKLVAAGWSSREIVSMEEKVRFHLPREMAAATRPQGGSS